MTLDCRNSVFSASRGTGARGGGEWVSGPRGCSCARPSERCHDRTEVDMSQSEWDTASLLTNKVCRNWPFELHTKQLISAITALHRFFLFIPHTSHSSFLIPSSRPPTFSPALSLFISLFALRGGKRAATGRLPVSSCRGMQPYCNP
jgi:hypothetical protein